VNGALALRSFLFPLENPRVRVIEEAVSAGSTGRFGNTPRTQEGRDMKKIALLAYPLVAVTVVSLAAADVVFAGHPAPEGCASIYAIAAPSLFAPAADATTQ
jgi:hypothetical protein